MSDDMNGDVGSSINCVNKRPEIASERFLLWCPFPNGNKKFNWLLSKLCLTKLIVQRQILPCSHWSKSIT